MDYEFATVLLSSGSARDMRRPGQANNLVSLKTDFQPSPGLANIFEGVPQIADNFRRNSFT
jgi:hypothetical protein